MHSLSNVVRSERRKRIGKKRVLCADKCPWNGVKFFLCTAVVLLTCVLRMRYANSATCGQRQDDVHRTPRPNAFSADIHGVGFDKKRMRCQRATLRCARVGHGKRHMRRCGVWSSSGVRALTMVLLTLLLVGGIERNPGPTTSTSYAFLQRDPHRARAICIAQTYSETIKKNNQRVGNLAFNMPRIPTGTTPNAE